MISEDLRGINPKIITPDFYKIQISGGSVTKKNTVGAYIMYFLIHVLTLKTLKKLLMGRETSN